MLAWRLGISAVLIPALFGLFYLDHRIGQLAPVLFVLCVGLAIRSAWELCELLTVRAMRPLFKVTAPLCVLAIVAAWTFPFGLADNIGGSLQAINTVFFTSVLILFMTGAARYMGPGTNMETLGAELIVVSYVGVLLAVTAQLRWVAGAQAGYLVLGSVIVSAKAGDTMAYTFGRLFGKTKMAPVLSPGKTWAGFVGAIVGSAAAGAAWLYFVPPAFGPDGIDVAKWKPVPVMLGAVYGSILGLVGLIGDLCESLIKRDCEKKDAAELMPGFGGLLDLLDSVLFAGPVALLLWWILPLKTW